MGLRAFKSTTRGLWVGRGLVAVGLVAMLVCVYFNARHGWNLGATIADKVALATMHGLVDIATALLVSAGAILFAWYLLKMGFAACAFALLLTLFSILSVSGFMSGRIAALESQKAALAVLEKQGKWAGGTTYRQAGNTERRSLRTEMRENTKEMVRVASLIPDSHALAIASILGWHVEVVQRWLILISSGMAQALKYVCLLVGFFLLSNRDERGAEPAQTEPANQKNSGGSGGSGGGEPGKLKVVRPEPKPEPAKVRAEPSKQRSVFYVPSTGAPERNLSAFDRAYEIATEHPYLSTRAIAARAGVSQSTGHRVKKRALTKVDRIMRKYGNGRSFQTPAYN